MTQPDQFTPLGAANFGSLAEWAGKTQAEWEAEIRASVESHFLDAEDGFNNLISAFTDVVQFVVAVLQKIPIVGDILEIVSGVEDGDFGDFGTGWNDAVGDIRQTIDNIVGGLFGWVGAGFGHSDALQALLDEAASVAALAAAVASLQNTAANQSAGGVSAFVDFSTRANAASLGSDFTQTYTGTGTGVLGITDGRAAWQPVNDATRLCQVVYNAAQSTTDYQMVGASFATAPVWGGNTSNSGHNFLVGRSNAAGDTCVYADFTKYSVELGCLVSNVKTVFATLTSGFSFKSNGVYWLQPGTVGGARIFRVLDGNTPIITHTEVGTTSQLGSGFRYTGPPVYAFANPFGTNGPGKVSAFAFADNQPPTLVGSGAYMYRAATADVGVTSGTNILSSFFDTSGGGTADITVDLTNSKFTVSMDGWYKVTARSKVASSAFPSRFTWILHVNGAADRYMGTMHARGLDGIAAPQTPEGVSGECGIHLLAGDYVQLGYNASNTVGSVLDGEAAGTQTYFSIALMNRSLA